MAHKPYATLAEATECLVDAIGIVRQGWDQVVAQKAAMGEHEHSIQGYIHSVVLGTTDGPFHAMSPDEQSEFDAKLQEFATAMQTCCPTDIPQAAVAEVTGGIQSHGAGRIDFKKWLEFFVTYILPLLLKS